MHKVGACATVAMAIFSALTFGAIVVQIFVSRSQARAFKLVEQAHLSITTLQFDGAGSAIQFGLLNSGHMPAGEVEFTGQAFIYGFPGEPRPEFRVGKNIASTPIAPGKDHFLSRVAINAGPEEAMRIKQGKRALLLLLTVAYDNGFGHRDDHGVCFYYDLSLSHDWERCRPEYPRPSPRGLSGLISDLEQQHKAGSH